MALCHFTLTILTKFFIKSEEPFFSCTTVITACLLHAPATMEAAFVFQVQISNLRGDGIGWHKGRVRASYPPYLSSNLATPQYFCQNIFKQTKPYRTHHLQILQFIPRCQWKRSTWPTVRDKPNFLFKKCFVMLSKLWSYVPEKSEMWTIKWLEPIL